MDTLLNHTLPSALADLPFWGFALTLLLFSYFASSVLTQVFSTLKNARLIEDTPTSKIRSAPQGYIELEGQAKPTPYLQQKSPLTYKPCCWYSYTIEEYVSRRVGQQTESRWETITQDTSPHLFMLDDGTGDCLISPLGAQITATKQMSWTARKLPAHLQIKAGGRRKYRFTEARIEPGDTLYVLGHFKSMHTQAHLHQEQDYQEKPQPMFGKKNRFRMPFIPQSQHVKTANKEWQALQKKWTEPKQIHLIRDNPGTKQPYLIANYPQEKLARKYRWQAIGYSVFFALLAAVPLTMLLSRFTSVLR